MADARGIVAIVAVTAAVSGCGSDAAPGIRGAEASDEASAFSPEPELSDAVAWSDRVDYERWEPPLPPGQDGWPTEPPSRWPDVQPELVLPPAVGAGETVSYVVVLRNRSDRTVDLRPCGGFRQEVRVVGAGLAAEPVSGGASTYRLNCDDAPLLRAGQSRRYAMQVVVPGAATGDEVLVSWGFVDNMPDYDAQQWIRLS